MTTIEEAGLSEARLDLAATFVQDHISKGICKGAQLTVARNNRHAYCKSFGLSRVSPDPIDARETTLWALYSQSKIFVSLALSMLAERGKLSLFDKVAEFLPDFDRNGKADVTVLQLLIHQAGFPNAEVPTDILEDHDRLRKLVADFKLETPPGSTFCYHIRAAHWVAGLVVEAITGTDFRQFIRNEIFEPLNLGSEIYLGLPEELHSFTSETFDPSPDGSELIHAKVENGASWKRAGAPAGGGFATGRGLAAFYQMLLNDGELFGKRIAAPSTLQFLKRDFSQEAVDQRFNCPMHYGLGLFGRGTSPYVQGMGNMASPRTFGHTGWGCSISWANPDTGLSFTFVSNARQPDPWSNRRYEILSNMIHSSVIR